MVVSGHKRYNNNHSIFKDDLFYSVSHYPHLRTNIFISVCLLLNTISNYIILKKNLNLEE